VVAWSLPKKVNLAGAVSGKPNHMATIFLSKAAPKSTRLDAAAIRKRAAAKGDAVVEMKAGDEVLSVSVAWNADRFVKAATSSPKGGKKKAAPAKPSANTKKPVKPAKTKPARKKKKK
jgi:hypothetical protein